MSESFPRNPGMTLDESWFDGVQVNRSAAERRADQIGTRRGVKKAHQAAWLVHAIRCIDLTTLAGDDTPGRVRRLSAKARQPLRPEVFDVVERIGVTLGPGSFTGLRVGITTAATLSYVLGVPAHGVCSLDAIAHDVGSDRELLVVTDARRREVYWARYRDGVRIDGPGVETPNDVEIGGATVIAGSASHVDLFDVAVEPVESPSPLGLVRPIASKILAGEAPEPLVPLYLRRPDAVPAGQR